MLVDICAEGSSVDLKVGCPSEMPEKMEVDMDISTEPVSEEKLETQKVTLPKIDEVPSQISNESCSKDPAELMKPRNVRNKGIVNGRFSCYANSTLQALLHCPDFAGLLHYAIHLGETVVNESKLMLADSMIKLYSQMDDKSELAISPSYIEGIMERVGNNFKMNVQEDAQEFLSMLLNKLHDEEVAFTKKKDESTFYNLILGDLQYIFPAEDGKIMKNYDSFLNLPINIDDKDIKNVQIALDHCWGVEDANEKTLLKKLPKLLILQMKCFSYDEGRASKVSKKFRVNKILTILSKHMTEEAKERHDSADVKYRIRSVVAHKGLSCNSGHYVSYASKDNTWTYFDDETIKDVNENVALKSSKILMPYILFYELYTGSEVDSGDDSEDEWSEYVPISPPFKHRSRNPWRNDHMRMNDEMSHRFRKGYFGHMDPYMDTRYMNESERYMTRREMEREKEIEREKEKARKAEEEKERMKDYEAQYNEIKGIILQTRVAEWLKRSREFASDKELELEKKNVIKPCEDKTVSTGVRRQRRIELMVKLEKELGSILEEIKPESPKKSDIKSSPFDDRSSKHKHMERDDFRHNNRFDMGPYDDCDGY